MKIKKGQGKAWKKVVGLYADREGFNPVPFCEDWAEKMELEFKGKFSHLVAERTLEELKKETVGGFTFHMYFEMIKVLAAYWIFGEALRQWHNIVRSQGDLSLTIEANMNNSIVLL